MILRLRIREDGCGIAEHVVSDVGVGLHGARDALEVILAERHERIGHEARLRRALDVAIGVGKAAKIFERAGLVLADAVAVRIHAAELPDGAGNALLGGEFELLDTLVGLALAQRLGARSKGLERRERWPAGSGDRSHWYRRQRSGGA